MIAFKKYLDSLTDSQVSVQQDRNVNNMTSPVGVEINKADMVVMGGGGGGGGDGGAYIKDTFISHLYIKDTSISMTLLYQGHLYIKDTSISRTSLYQGHLLY